MGFTFRTLQAARHERRNNMSFNSNEFIWICRREEQDSGKTL